MQVEQYVGQITGGRSKQIWTMLEMRPEFKYDDFGVIDRPEESPIGSSVAGYSGTFEILYVFPMTRKID